MSARFYVGLTPWLVFAVVGRGSGQGPAWAALVALAATFAVIYGSRRSGSITSLNAGAVAVFGALAVAATVVGARHVQMFGRVYAAGGLMVIALASLLFVPFVEEYTKDLVQSSNLASAQFRVANRAVTLIWAIAFGAITASFLLAALIRTRLAATAFNWLVPGFVLLYAIERATARWEHDFDPEEELGDLDALKDVMGI